MSVSKSAQRQGEVVDRALPVALARARVVALERGGAGVLPAHGVAVVGPDGVEPLCLRVVRQVDLEAEALKLFSKHVACDGGLDNVGTVEAVHTIGANDAGLTLGGL